MKIVNKKLLNLFFVSFLTFFATITSVAQAIVHEVSKGETLYSLSRHYGVTIDTILKANSELKNNKNYKLKTGHLLNIPHATLEKEVKAIDTIRLSVILPFNGNAKITNRVIEYYRGLLTATYAAKESGYNVEISTFDEPKQSESILPILNQIKDMNPDFIVGPLYPTHFSEISNHALSYRQRVLIPFSSKVDGVHDNPYLYLLNTPDDLTKKNTIKLFDSTFKNSRLVLVRTQKANQLETSNLIMEHCLNNKYEVQTLPSIFFSEDLKRVFSTECRNVVIMDGSDKSEVATTLMTLSKFKENNPDYQVCIIGHSDWQLFSMEESSLLSAADTYILAPDYYNAYDKGVINFEEQYYKWFNTYPAIYHPRMGELGYDSGLFMLNAIALYGDKFDSQPVGAHYLQTNLKFKQISSHGGYANVGLLFIHYTNDQKIECIELK